MKKILLVLILLITAGTVANSQITVTDVDFADIEDSVIYAVDSTAPPNMSVGGTGNQTWDFNWVQLDSYDTVRFIDPTTTQFGSFFPNSTIGMSQTDGVFYLIKNSNYVELDGFAGDPSGFLGEPIPLNFSNNFTFIEFPADYLSSFTDTALVDITLPDTFLNQADSLRYKRVTYIDADIDAWGDVTTPAGTFSSLRLYRQEINIDSVWALLFSNWTLLQNSNEVVHNYSWWASGEDYPVVEVEADAQGGDALSANFKIGAKVVAFIQSYLDESAPNACDGEATVGAVSGVSPYNYFWDDSNTQTTQTATGLCPGTYTVTVVDAINDSSTATITIAVGIDETNPMAHLVSIYPNPTNGSITLNLSNLNATQLTIYNVLGEEVMTNAINNSITVVNLKELQNGIYFLKVETPAGSVTKKVNLIR